MFYSILSMSLWAFACIALLLALRGVFRRSWVWGWFRGVYILLFLSFAALLTIMGWDLRSYHTLQSDEPLLIVAFEKVNDKAYVATLTRIESGEQNTYYLRGDQWQIDARILRWKGLAKKLGGKPGYRLDRIGGRYFSLSDETSRERTVYSLYEGESQWDIWAYTYKSQGKVPILDAVYGNATYMPMANGAEYEVSLTQSGIIAKPINKAAQQAQKMWLN